MNEDWIAYFVDDIQRHYEDRYGILFVRFAHAVNETRRLANLYLQQAVEEEYMNWMGKTWSSFKSEMNSVINFMMYQCEMSSKIVDDFFPFIPWYKRAMPLNILLLLKYNWRNLFVLKLFVGISRGSALNIESLLAPCILFWLAPKKMRCEVSTLSYGI